MQHASIEVQTDAPGFGEAAITTTTATTTTIAGGDVMPLSNVTGPDGQQQESGACGASIGSSKQTIPAIKQPSPPLERQVKLAAAAPRLRTFLKHNRPQAQARVLSNTEQLSLASSVRSAPVAVLVLSSEDEDIFEDADVSEFLGAFADTLQLNPANAPLSFLQHMPVNTDVDDVEDTAALSEEGDVPQAWEVSTHAHDPCLPGLSKH